MTELRSPQSKDLDKIIELEEANFPHPWAPDVFEMFVTHPHSLLLDGVPVKMIVATEEGSVLGYIVWTEGRDLELGRILNISVSRERWGSGIGRKLMNYALDSMRSMNMAEVRLEVRESNSRAISFYEHLGFKKRERIPDFYENEDALCYYLLL